MVIDKDYCEMKVRHARRLIMLDARKLFETLISAGYTVRRYGGPTNEFETALCNLIQSEAALFHQDEFSKEGLAGKIFEESAIEFGWAVVLFDWSTIVRCDEGMSLVKANGLRNDTWGEIYRETRLQDNKRFIDLERPGTATTHGHR